MTPHKNYIGRFLRFPFLFLRGYFKYLLHLTGVTRQQLSFPLHLFLNSQAYPILSKVLFPASASASLFLYLIKLLKIIFLPNLVLQRLVLLVLFQSLYELGGLCWRTVRWGLWSNISLTGKKVKEIRSKMNSAVTYQEWRNARVSLGQLLLSKDNYLSLSEKRNIDKLDAKIKSYEELLDMTSEELLRKHLRQDLLRKDIVQPTGNLALKKKAREYQETLLKALSSIATCKDKGLDIIQELKVVRERMNFLNETQLAFGNSALLLSGGATLGLIHFGVLKALLEQQLLPKVIGGSSAGALCAALMGCSTDDELRKFFIPENLNLRFLGRIDSLAKDIDKLMLSHKKDLSETVRTESKSTFSSTARRMIIALPPPLQEWVHLFRRLLPKYIDSKELLSGEILANSIRGSIGDMTFLEAYRKTGRVLNISVTPRANTGSSKLPQLLNYLTAPDIIIWSAAVASSSIPGVFAPQPLYRKDLEGNILRVDEVRGVDGSVECDLPISRIKEMFDVNHFIVSQVNPHARVIAPHLELNFYGFMPSALADISNQLFQQLGAVVMFLRDQIRSWAKHVVDFSLNSFWFIKPLGKGVMPLLIQKYHGDITLSPTIYPSDLRDLLKNPTREFFLNSRLRGERMTWQYISKIRNRCAIEHMLSDCISVLKERELRLENILFETYRSSNAFLKKSISRSKLDNLEVKLQNRVMSMLHFTEVTAGKMPIESPLELVAEEFEDLIEEDEEIDEDVPMF